MIGGGLSGLGFANNIDNALIIEKNNCLGGHVGSFEFKEFHFDYGAHICHSRDELWLEGLNLKSCVIHSESYVANYDNASWIGYPVQNNLKDIPISTKDKAYSEINNNLRAGNIDSTNYLTWCNSVYGETLTEEYYRRFTNKYWRTQMEHMSADWLSGRVMPIDKALVDGGMKGEVKSQAVFSSYKYPSKGGFQELFWPLMQTDNDVVLGDPVINIDLDERVVSLESGAEYRYSKLVNTAPLTEIIKIINNVPSEIKEASSQLRYLNLIVTAVVIPDFSVDEFPDWFYVYDENIEVSRVTNISKVSGSKVDGIALQFETFRRDDEIYNLSEVYIEIEKSLQTLIGREVLRSEITHRFVKYSYVVPGLNTGADRSVVLNYLTDNGILSCGLYGLWNYVWSEQAYKSGVDLAEKQKSGDVRYEIS